MELTLKVVLPDNTYEVSTTLWTVIQWERKFKRKASDMVNGIGAEDLAYLAWEASKEQKVVVPASFDDFCKKLKATPEVVDGISEAGSPNFTQPEPIEDN